MCLSYKDNASFETFQLILQLEVIIYTDHREFLMLSVLKSTGLVYIYSNLAVKWPWISVKCQALVLRTESSRIFLLLPSWMKHSKLTVKFFSKIMCPQKLLFMENIRGTFKSWPNSLLGPNLVVNQQFFLLHPLSPLKHTQKNTHPDMKVCPQLFQGYPQRRKKPNALLQHVGSVCHLCRFQLNLQTKLLLSLLAKTSLLRKPSETTCIYSELLSLHQL